jgi:AraC-like DNA-binding protein
MKIYSKWGELPIAESYEKPPADLILPGAGLKVAKNLKKGYCFIFQEFETQHFFIRFSNLFCYEKDAVTIVTDPGICFRLAAYRSHQFMLKYLGKQLFHQRQYNLFFAPHASVDYFFEAGDIFGFLDIILKPDYAQQLAGQFPILHDFLKPIALKSPAKLYAYNQVAPIEVIRWYQELEDWGFKIDKDKQAGDELVQRLIREALSTAKPNPDNRPLKLTQAEVNSIYYSAEFIYKMGNIFTTEELARLVNLSTYKLEQGFKQIYGHSLSKHEFEEKMLIALRIIEDKHYKSKEVADALGYSDPQSFSRAFKKRFGHAPFR